MGIACHEGSEPKEKEQDINTEGQLRLKWQGLSMVTRAPVPGGGWVYVGYQQVASCQSLKPLRTVSRYLA